MWKYVGYFYLSISFASSLFSMTEHATAWRYSDQHKLIKSKSGIVMDYSYDHATCRWMLNSECWSDVMNNYFTRQYVAQKGDVQVCIFYQNRLGAPILLDERHITYDEYEALDLNQRCTQ